MTRRRMMTAALAAMAAPLLPTLGVPALAQAPDAATLARVEAYLNALTTLRARFLQVAQNGASAQGTAWIWRPGRMRFDYDPPEPLLLVASGGQVMMYDRELRQPSTVPASSTPLGVLLRERIRLSGDITVVGMERRGGFLHVTLQRTDAPAEGRLTLTFQEDPMQLRQWTVVDAQGRETRVTLYEVDTTIRPDPKLFDFNDPRFLEQEGARR
ncbi:LolA family protein [Falsiroseomonas sp.]|uniref:LolA family protein n=1 Tax=Falsiroseomonas sp. TaxID=2870721 RepID=UPI003563948C